MLFLIVLPQFTGIAPNPAPAQRPYQISSSGPSRYRAPLPLAMSIPGRMLGAQCVKQARGRKERGSGRGFLMAGDSQQPSGHSLLKILSRLPSKSRAHWLRAQVATVTARTMAAPPLSRCFRGRPSSGPTSRSLVSLLQSLLRSLLQSLLPVPPPGPKLSLRRRRSEPWLLSPRCSPACGSSGAVCCCTPLGAFRSFISAELWITGM